MRLRRTFLALVALCLASALAPTPAIALLRDPTVVADDALGTPGNFFHAVTRISFLNGGATQLTAGNALPDAQALAFTGPDTLVTVGSNTLARLNLTSGQLVNVPAPGTGQMRGVALAPDGSVFAVDFGPSNGTPADGRVVRLDPANGSSTVIASGGFLNNPIGIAVAEDGIIYVTNADGAGHGQVLRINPSNGAQSIVAAAPLVVPWGIAFLPDGDLVVADATYNGAFRGALVRIDPVTGEQTARFLENLSVTIENATGVAVEDSGDVLVTERSQGEVDRVNLETGVTQQVGSGVSSPLDVEPEPGFPPSTKFLSGPSGTTRNPTPTFTFQPSQYGSTSQCSIDRGNAVPCQRTFTTPPLSNGEHSVFVSSTRFGAHGTQAVRNFTVDPNALDTQIDSGPSSLTNDPTPTFTFEAPGGGTTFTCSIDEAIPSPCVTPFTTALLTDGPHTFTVRANGDNVGDTRSFTVDTTAPETSITSGPAEGSSTAATQPTFTLGSTELGSTFKCAVDGVPVLCTSVFTPGVPLIEGPHTLAVAATDQAGNPDQTPLERHFTVDTTTPVTTITGGPDGTTGEAAPTFTFSASEAGVFFKCSIDSATLTICASPFTVAPALADGPHTFRVQAIDAAGNTETPIQRDFTVDALVPDTSITAGPTGLTNDPSPTFAFESTKPGSTFVCALDGGAAAPCDTPFKVAPQSEEAHTFTVTATDALGHPDPTPATRSFTVDVTPPQTTLGDGPGPLTNDRTPEFNFASEPGATFSCSLDNAAATPCTSPLTAPPLADGAHSFEVTATDQATNADPTPSQLAFTVDTIAPETSIDGGPDGDTTESRPTFSFSATQVATFLCSIDGAAPIDCDLTFRPATPLALGAHTFDVTATDSAGNADQSPAHRSFRVIAEEAKKDPPNEPPPREQAPVSPDLRLRASLHARVLRVRISANPAATGSVAVEITGRLGHKRLKRHLNLTLQAGLANGTLHLPPGIPRLRLVARYGGDAHYTSASGSQTVRQTR